MDAWFAWLNHNSGAVQALTTMVLVAITIYSVWVTRSMARATVGMARAGEQQRLDGVRPVVAFRLDAVDPGDQWGARIVGAPSTDRFVLDVINAGVGPALDLDVDVEDSPLMYYKKKIPSFPVAISVGESLQIDYAINDRLPFRDEADPLRWPRNDEDTAVEQRVNRPLPGADKANQHFTNQADLKRRRDEFMREVRDKIAPLTTVGVVKATYRDVHGRRFTSRAELRAVSLSFPGPVDYWRPVELGPLSLDQTD